MKQWIRQAQERPGNYFFSGQFLVTRGIAEALSQAEIRSIYLEVQRLVQEHKGLDYLQVFSDEAGQKLFFIDQLNQDMIASGGYSPEDNHCTLMFNHEY